MDTKLFKKSFYITVTGMVAAIALPFIMGVLIAPLFHTDFQRLFYSRLIFWADVALLYLYARRVEQVPFLLWPENKYKPSFYLLEVLKLYGLAICAMVISAFVVLFGWHDDTAVLKHWLHVITQFWWLIVFCAITAGVTEELIMRAYLLPRMQLIFRNNNLAVAVNAVVFSAMHYRYFNLKEIVFTFLIGLIFSVHYQKFRNIKVLIAAHFLIDFVSFLLGKFLIH